MIDWVTILIALGIIVALVGGFGIVAWKISISDPLTSENVTGRKDDTNQLFDSVNDKKKKDKHGNDQGKKRRKPQKKPKRDTKDDEHQRHSVTFKEPSTPTSDETDNEREESEQELSITPQVVEGSSKARKRRNKARPSTPPSSSGHIEGILANKNEKSPVTTRAQPIPHPILATIIPKDEVELAKQHQQQAKVQVKASQQPNKQTVPAPPASVKKPISPSANVNQGGPKQQQEQQQQEQPFTTVVGKGHKTGTPPVQQQQQTKSVNTTVSTTTTVPAPATQQQATPVQVQHEQLAPRQPPRQQRETPTQVNGFNTNSLPVKQPAVATALAPPTKLADLVKALPTSQAVVTELMQALDAFPLSTDELDIIMQKIANKQSVVNRDWAKLQHGQKVNPQAHIGEVLDESARAYEKDMRNNAMKHIKDLTDELNNDKRRINDLVKETNEKDINIQVLRSQLSTVQHPQQQFQTYEVEYRRLNEENMQLKQRLAQQQQHFQQQQQQLSSLNLINNNTEPTNVQARVLNDQIRKLSIDNGKLEKQLSAKELLTKEIQKEKDDLIRSNQQLAQKAQESQKQFQHNEEKLLKELNESRTLHMNQLNECKRRIEELELNNEQLRHAAIAHVEPKPTTLDNEERNKFEQEINQLKQQLTDENEQYKKKLDEIQIQRQSQENELRQEIEQLKNSSEQRQHEQTTSNNELADKNAQLDALRAELEEAKARNDLTNSQLDERLRQEQEKHKQFLSELLEQDIRNQLPSDNQDFNQWLSSYRQLFVSSNESNKRTLQEESEALKREIDELHKNMNDAENQSKAIEQIAQSREENLITDLKSKDTIIESIRSENERLNGEIDRLKLAYNAAVDETQTLKVQLEERSLVTANDPSITADESFEIIKQTSSPPTEVDTRPDELHELIRSGIAALDNQDSIAQQLDKKLNEMHRGGTGETSTANGDESTISSSSDQQQQQQSES